MIYIQSDPERGVPYHFDSACAMYGAIENEMEYRLTPFDEVRSGKFDSEIKNNLFVGSVEFMREVFNRVGVKDVRLPLNSNRKSEIITLGEANERSRNGEKLFIKPVEIKLFTGFVLDGMVYSAIEDLPSDTRVFTYKPFDKEIVSEWRIYVNKWKIEDSRNYAGDFRISPDYRIIDDLIDECCDTENFPNTFTIDVAILEDWSGTEIVVVEYNDMWAIGNYGVPNYFYLKLLRDRYFQIVNQ